MKKIFFQFALILAGFAALISGCKPAVESDSSPVAKAPAPISASVAPMTFSSLPVPPEPAVTPDFIAHGKMIYQQNCAACHGVNGDGKGDAAAFLVPKPRNFLDANYRLRSTPNSHLPTDADLFRAVSLGMPGTPMPAWRHILSDNDRWALVEYLKTFSPRFSNFNEDRAAVVSIGNPPARNESAIAEGKALFTKLSCVTCHGESGRGDGPSSINLVDDSHTKISPRDFTRPAAFKSGYATKEIVRTILTGFNGTPMLGFNGTVSDQDAWKVAYYVETFAKSAPPAAIARASQGFAEAEKLGEPDVRVRVTERAWKYDPAIVHVKKGQVVEITFEPTDNGLGAGHGFAISSYDEMVFLNGAMVGTPKTAKFRADRAGKFTYYCATQCSTEKLHPQMNGTLIVEEDAAKQSVSTE